MSPERGEGYKPPEAGRPPSPETRQRYTPEMIEKGVNFAHSLFEMGIIPDNEYNAVASAHARIKTAQVGERVLGIELLTKWADRAKEEEMLTEVRATENRAVRTELGRDMLEEAMGATRELDSLIKYHFLMVKDVGGDPKRAAEMWREFGLAVSPTVHTGDKPNPQRLRKLEIALRVATALLSEKPSIAEQDKEVLEGVEELKRRFKI